MMADEKQEKKQEEIEVEFFGEGETLDFEKKIKNLKEKLRMCREEKDEYLTGWQRERADFINYKKEEEERKKREEIFLKKRLYLEILLILDNLERAEKNLPENLKEDLWTEGIIKIKKQIEEFIKKEGIKEIEIKLGDDFNPEFCEAIEIIEGEDNKIMEIIQKGYLYNEKVLRVAKVKVGKRD